MTRLQKLQDIIRKNPGLAWDTTKYDKIPTEGVVERILNYGNWKEYLASEKILGIKQLKNLFEKMTHRKRINLRPQVVNYFSKYFQKYA